MKNNFVDKEILDQYIDACSILKEIEQEVKKLEKEKCKIEKDKVSGSNHDFPYQRQSFSIEGVVEKKSNALERKRKVLQKQRAQAEEIKLLVEEWIPTLPLRTQRIVRLRFIDGLSWREVARKLIEEQQRTVLELNCKDFRKKLKSFVLFVSSVVLCMCTKR